MQNKFLKGLGENMKNVQPDHILFIDEQQYRQIEDLYKGFDPRNGIVHELHQNIFKCLGIEKNINELPEWLYFNAPIKKEKKLFHICQPLVDVKCFFTLFDQ